MSNISDLLYLLSVGCYICKKNGKQANKNTDKKYIILFQGGLWLVALVQCDPEEKIGLFSSHKQQYKSVDQTETTCQAWSFSVFVFLSNGGKLHLTHWLVACGALQPQMSAHGVKKDSTAIPTL